MDHNQESAYSPEQTPEPASYQAPEEEASGQVSLQKPNQESTGQHFNQAPYQTQTAGQAPYQMQYQSPYQSPNQIPGEDNKPGGLAIASLVLGILSLVTCCIGIGAVFGLAAIILGAVSLYQKKGKGLAIAGIITGGFGLVLGIIGIIYIVAVVYEINTDPIYREIFWEEFYESYYNLKLKPIW